MHNLVKSSVVEHEHSPGSFPVNIRIHLLNFDLPIPAIEDGHLIRLQDRRTVQHHLTSNKHGFYRLFFFVSSHIKTRSQDFNRNLFRIYCKGSSRITFHVKVPLTQQHHGTLIQREEFRELQFRTGI